MSWRFFFAVFAALAAAPSNWPLLAESPAEFGSTWPAMPPRTHDVRLNGQKFTLPLGFEIELAASSELVPRPISADFDDVGRLYVGDYADTTEDVVAQLMHPPHPGSCGWKAPAATAGSTRAVSLPTIVAVSRGHDVAGWFALCGCPAEHLEIH